PGAARTMPRRGTGAPPRRGAPGCPARAGSRHASRTSSGSPSTSGGRRPAWPWTVRLASSLVDPHDLLVRGRRGERGAHALESRLAEATCALWIGEQVGERAPQRVPVAGRDEQSRLTVDDELRHAADV